MSSGWSEGSQAATAARPHCLSGAGRGRQCNSLLPQHGCGATMCRRIVGGSVQCSQLATALSKSKTSSKWLWQRGLQQMHDTSSQVPTCGIHQEIDMHCAGHQPAAAVSADTSPCSQLASSRVCRRLLGTLRSRTSRRTSPSAACTKETRAVISKTSVLIPIRVKILHCLTCLTGINAVSLHGRCPGVGANRRVIILTGLAMSRAWHVVDQAGKTRFCVQEHVHCGVPASSTGGIA